MASAVGEAKQTLRLALRPDDPFAVPLQAERVRASRLGVLLKVGIRGDALEFPLENIIISLSKSLSRKGAPLVRTLGSKTRERHKRSIQHLIFFACCPFSTGSPSTWSKATWRRRREGGPGWGDQPCIPVYRSAQSVSVSFKVTSKAHQAHMWYSSHVLMQNWRTFNTSLRFRGWASPSLKNDGPRTVGQGSRITFIARKPCAGYELLQSSGFGVLPAFPARQAHRNLR